MTAARVSKVLCPCCKGTGKSRFFPCCAWCGSTGRLSPARAMAYAATVKVYAEGGYLAGDHDEGTMRAMLDEARDVRAFVLRVTTGVAT